jgi:iron complex outermembrane receptor protein
MRFPICLLPACLLVVVMSVARAEGQDDFKQTIVVTAAGTPVALGSVTRTLTVITREQIALLPARSVADVLRLASSVDVRARGERGVQTDFAVRGANFGQMLVLVDGVRLNDAQSGHHNGDIPVPLDAIERIEVLHGPGSSLFGADAFGGTLNVITKRAVTPASATIEGGSFGLVAGRGQAGVERGEVRQTVAASVERSAGFMFARDFKTAAVSSRTSIGGRTGVLASYLWKDFGANGFYGASPSHEWTNQTLVALDHRLGAPAGWQLGGEVSYRTHGDRFLWDVRRPGQLENRHRTHAALGSLKASRRIGDATSLAAGVEGGGDWIRSSNLGDHATSRISGFGEWRQAAGARTQIDASLRVDRYSEFGTSWSPALGVGWWPTPAVRLRASAGRAFRVPTFTERYYSDPAHLARADLRPETAWAGEAGADVLLASGWTARATLFGRLEHDVIDWLRPTPDVRWRTYNIRDVDIAGVEIGASRMAGGVFVHAEYTFLDVRAASVSELSKYVLDYAPHGLAGGVAVSLPGSLRLAPRLEYKRRSRTAGTSDYVLLDTRLGRRFGRYELFIEGQNLFDVAYQEVVGVDMPGRSVSASVAVGLR